MYSIRKASPLRGEVTIPGDKSISHRSVMFGALARGTTRISGFLNGQDCLSTVDCFRRLGVRIDLSPDGHSVTVAGKGMRGLTAPERRIRLYTGNSGTTTRIISGILAPQSFTTILSGDNSVNRRPMGRIISPLRSMGADIRSLSDNGCAPLEINGRPLHGTVWRSPVASAQVKSAVLCAGLYADSPTVLIEPSLSRDHTERMLASFGANITSEQKEDGWYASIKPCEELYARDITVPGDISSAAYFIAPAFFTGRTESVLRLFDFSTHFSDFAGGIVTVQNVVYFLSFIAAGLILPGNELLDVNGPECPVGCGRAGLCRLALRRCHAANQIILYAAAQQRAEPLSQFAFHDLPGRQDNELRRSGHKQTCRKSFYGI